MTPLAVRLGQVGVLVVGLGLWQSLALWAGPSFLPGPKETALIFQEGLVDGWLTESLAVTLKEVAWGYLWAVAAGLVAGFLLGMSPLLRDAFEGPILSLSAIPKVTLFPIFLFLFRLGSESKIAFGAFHGVFPVAILTWGAMAAIKPVHLKVARTLRLNSLQLFRSVVVPSILPSLMTGLRLGFNLTFLGVILGEMFGARRGLGFLLMSFGAAFDMGKTLVVIGTVAVMAMAVNGALYVMERRLGPEAEAGAAVI